MAHDNLATLDDPQDIDRAAILARRQRFVLMALGGLFGVPGCERTLGCDAPTLTPSFEIHRQSLVTSADPAGDPSQEFLAAVRARCRDPLLAELQARSTADLSEEQRVELARAGIERAEQAHRAGDHACALALYDLSYWLVPGKHPIAFLVGELAYEMASEPGACALAREYLVHFSKYADPWHHAFEFERAAAMLLELDQQRCGIPEPFPERYEEPMPCLQFAPDPRPFAPPGACDRPQRKRGHGRSTGP